MTNLKTKIAFSVLLAGLTVSQTKPIRLEVARAGAVGAGLATIGIGWYSLKNNNFGWLISTVAGAGVGFGAYKALYALTPEGQVEEATSRIERAYKNPIATDMYTIDSEFYNALREVYIDDDLWLISAHGELVIFLREARESLELIDAARVEAAEDYVLVQQCNKLAPKARELLRNLTAAVKRIQEHAEYMPQQKLHQEMLAAEKQLHVQREVAAAERDKAAAQWAQAEAQQDAANAQREAVEIQKAAA